MLRIIFYICLGCLPSLIWLSFYLRKDKHPEPNSIVLKLFAAGILVGPLAVIVELFLVWIIYPGPHLFSAISPSIEANGILSVLLVSALVPAFSEEYLKYKMVKLGFIDDREFDEPTDTMIYCIVVGLGFAAIENMVVLLRVGFPEFQESLSIIGFRFLGATLVHALACGMVGYWLSQGIRYEKKRKTYIAIGLLVAIALHACYNYLVMTVYSAKGHETFFISIIALLLTVSAVLVSSYFRRLKQQKSVCYE